MLLRFICENFKSFRDETEFSMVASKITRHPGHVSQCNGKRVLRGAFMFGANAGGKSNFVKAIDFARRVVIDGLERTNCDRMNFLLSPSGSENKIGRFQFDVFANGRFYSYGFAIDYLSVEIVGEWLSTLDGPSGETCLFSRIKDETGNTTIESDCHFQGDEKKRFDVYKEDMKKSGMRRTLFLSDVAKRSSNTEDFSSRFQDVFSWFQRLLVLFPETRFTGIPSFVHDDNGRLQYSEWLKHFDTGIESLLAKDVSIDKCWEYIPSDIRENVKADVFRLLSSDQKPSAIALNCRGSYYCFYSNGDGIKVKKIVAVHGRPDIPFEREDESEGTQRLFDLLPLIPLLRQNGVAVIDELDRSLHTKATLEFIRLFYGDDANANSQLIATTHDGELLDLDQVRQDEIWFVERNEEKSSSLYSLSKFKTRFDKDIKKDYLLGRYGALPIFGEIQETGEDGHGDE
ncbi:MAG: ATP-binding protein [Victivallales bacterium]|nr:ATP-binding protein [Victivallales bacterium]